MDTQKRYSPEVRERAVRLFEQALHDHSSRWAASGSLAEKLGCTTESPRRRIKQAEIDSGHRDGLSTGEHEEMKAIKREGRAVARCTVARLMKDLGIRGVVRGKRWKTTIANESAEHPQDHVDRQSFADQPNRLWVANFSDVSTWRGIVFAAFVIDVFSRRIVGWRVSHSISS